MESIFTALDSEAASNSFRATYGIKKEFFLSNRVVTKIKNISELSGRTGATVFSFCMRHALFIGAFNALKTDPVIIDKTSFGTRIPKKWLQDLGELAWEKDTTINALSDYLCNYSLSAKTIESWGSFFRNTEDIVFDIWMYIYTRTECQNSNLSFLEHLNTLKPSTRSKIFNQNNLT